MGAGQEGQACVLERWLGAGAGVPGEEGGQPRRRLLLFRFLQHTTQTPVF